MALGHVERGIALTRPERDDGTDSTCHQHTDEGEQLTHAGNVEAPVRPSAPGKEKGGPVGPP